MGIVKLSKFFLAVLEHFPYKNANIESFLLKKQGIGKKNIGKMLFVPIKLRLKGEHIVLEHF